jgi:hypothetical protein
MAWTEEQIRKCLGLWRADLKAMTLGCYEAPLPHHAMMNLSGSEYHRKQIIAGMRRKRGKACPMKG